MIWLITSSWCDVIRLSDILSKLDVIFNPRSIPFPTAWLLIKSNNYTLSSLKHQASLVSNSSMHFVNIIETKKPPFYSEKLSARWGKHNAVLPGHIITPHVDPLKTVKEAKEERMVEWGVFPPPSLLTPLNSCKSKRTSKRARWRGGKGQCIFFQTQQPPEIET